MKHNVAPSAELVSQLYGHFPTEMHDSLQSLTGPPILAPLHDAPGEFVPYVRANEGASRPVLYVPGFGEGITNKLPFAAALAQLDLDVLLPGQNRSGLAAHAIGTKRAIATQARNILAVSEHAGIIEAFDIVAHSFGGPVTEEVVGQLQEMSFDTSEMNVVLLASAGLAKEKSYANLLRRWVRFIGSEWGPKNKEFPDYTGEMGKASLRNLAANPRQTYAEAKALRHETLNVGELCRNVGRVILVNYKDDAMYPPSHVEPAVDGLLKNPELSNLVVLTPVTYGNPDKGEALGLKPGSVHDDEQLNPSRVVNALKPFLQKVAS